MIVVQVLGTNGSGKSRLLQEMARLDHEAVARIESVGDGRAGTTWGVPLTFLPRWEVVLVGDYLGDHKTPGADKLRGGPQLLATLDHALLYARGHGYAVVWEGIMLLTRAFPKAYTARGLRAVYPLLTIAPQQAYERVVRRSGPTKRGVDKVAKRNREVESLARWIAATRAGDVWPYVADVADPGQLARTILKRLWALRNVQFEHL